MTPKLSPPTETMDISDVIQQLNHLVTAVNREEGRILIEKNGRPVAALISPRHLALLARYEAQREADFAAIFRIGEAFADVPPEEIERQTDLAVAEVRAEMRAEREAAARAAAERRDQSAAEPAETESVATA